MVVSIEKYTLECAGTHYQYEQMTENPNDAILVKLY